MNKQELKKMLKPLIKECIKEVVFEEGALSTIVKEVMKGASGVVVENAAPTPQAKAPTPAADQKIKQLYERKKHLLDSIGKDAFNGVDIFEGTTAAPSPTQQSNGPLGNLPATDPGVDISSFAIKSSTIWQKMSEK